MGAFLFKLQRGMFKVRRPEKEKKRKAKVLREQPLRGRLPYFGWSWPRVVGLTANEAKTRIERECPGVYCEIVSVNQLLTMDYRSGRVRLLVDRYGTVVKTPRVG